MTFKLKTRAIAALAAAVLAPATVFAAPSTTLYGGGATLIATAYAGPSWLTGNPPAGGANPAPSPSLRLTNPADAGSHFGAYSASTNSSPIGFAPGTSTRPTVSYCQTGSTGGRNGLTGGAAGTTFANGTCPDFSATPTGFGSPNNVVEPHYAASDAPMSNSDYTNFLNNKGGTRAYPVQVPVIAAAIGVVFNNVQSPNLTLTESQICQIFSGQINNWNQLGRRNKPIKIVYRSDGSGTSFSFSNHLSAVCPTAQPIGVAGLSTQSAFSAAFVGGVPPAGSIASSGNGGVAATVAATDGAIGYAEISDAKYRATIPGGTQLKFALVKLRSGTNASTGKPFTAKNPLNLRPTFALSGGLISDVVLGANSNGRPTLVAIAAPARAGCVLTADPDTYATAKINPTSNDYESYPIMGVSYLLAYGVGNGEDTLNIRALFASFFGPSTAGTIKNATDTVGPNEGFAYLSGFVNPTNSVIKPCIRS